MKQPFTMTVSPRCVSYYVVGLDTEGQEIYQGRGRCHECRVNPQVIISPYHFSNTNHFKLTFFTFKNCFRYHLTLFYQSRRGWTKLTDAAPALMRI